MPRTTYVVVIEGTDLYLTGYNASNPPASIFGNLNNAVIYSTLDAAQTAASLIGGGTVGTTKPNH